MVRQKKIEIRGQKLGVRSSEVRKFRLPTAYCLLPTFFLAVLLITLPFSLAQDATQLLSEGKAYLDVKDYTSALAKLQTLVTQYPASTAVPESLYNIGLCQFRLKNATSAVTTLNTLIQQYSVDTWSKNGYRLLGYSYSSLHQDTEAIAAFQTFINENPTSSNCPDARLRIARLTSRSNPTDTLLRLNAYKSVIDSCPNTPEAKEAQVSYGRILWRISEEMSHRNLADKLAKKDETISYFTTLSQQYAGDTELAAYNQMRVGALWIEKARLLNRSEDTALRKEYFARAKTELTQVLNQYPVIQPDLHATIKLMLAEITVFTRDNQSALPEFKNIIEEFGADSSCRRPVCMAQYLVAWIAESERKYTEAIKEYQKVLDNYNTTDNYLWTNVQALSLYSQYRCYVELENNAAGAEVLLKLINQYPNEEVAQRAKEELDKIPVVAVQ